MDSVPVWEGLACGCGSYRSRASAESTDTPKSSSVFRIPASHVVTGLRRKLRQNLFDPFHDIFNPFKNPLMGGIVPGRVLIVLKRRREEAEGEEDDRARSSSSPKACQAKDQVLQSHTECIC